MKYLKIKDGVTTYPYSLSSLSIDFPNTSFSPNTDLTDWGIHEVLETQPAFLKNKKYNVGTPVLSNGKYVQVWIESNKTVAEIQTEINDKWASVRTIRNQFLKDSDFTMLEDFPQRGTSLIAWKSYRQALRDVTLQLDPFTIIWPTKPI